MEEANCRERRALDAAALALAQGLRDHLGDPHAPTRARCWRDLGRRGFLGFQVLFLGGMTSYLAMPLFWLLWTGALGLDLPLWDHLAPGVDGRVLRLDGRRARR